MYFKKSILATSVLLMLGLGSGCFLDQDSACFETEFSSYEVGETVVFKNCSDAATDYLWDFGDGEQQYGTSATHIYNTAGNYTVTLTAYFGDESKFARGVVEVIAPTELQISTYFEGTYNAVAGVDVILYKSLSDWEKDVNRVASTFTDANGVARFTSDRTNGFNLNAQQYYLYASKNTENGSGYYSNQETNYQTSVLNVGQINYFEIDLRFYPYKSQNIKTNQKDFHKP